MAEFCKISHNCMGEKGKPNYTPTCYSLCFFRVETVFLYFLVSNSTSCHSASPQSRGSGILFSSIGAICRECGGCGGAESFSIVVMRAQGAFFFFYDLVIIESRITVLQHQRKNSFFHQQSFIDCHPSKVNQTMFPLLCTYVTFF